ncbi:DUF1285 domain-containing protein [Kordiimonas laminariae]|uniref:DUF1285 domain-containing protein n=1 Tax=Kordiimonas laminariae TaxID=2917717 RepID=UPI001FF155B4|nr:DUF1285 domain-containing protein [Kordiimonas laminariae]MCK0068566.1 DUF1285 domain-containing protein [Kordiimonas laminariae]
MAENKQHASFSLEGLLKQVEGQKYPPVDKWNPDFCGDIDMRIASDGTWFYMGTPITRSRMVKLFSSVLRKDSDGKTYLVTPVEKIGITVDDAHFTAIRVDVEDDTLVFTTNVGDKVAVDAEHPISVHVDETTEEPRPYVRVRGNLDALVARSVFYELVEMANEVKNGAKTELMVSSAGCEFSLGQWSTE